MTRIFPRNETAEQAEKNIIKQIQTPHVLQLSNCLKKQKITSDSFCFRKRRLLCQMLVSWVVVQLCTVYTCTETPQPRGGTMIGVGLKRFLGLGFGLGVGSYCYAKTAQLPSGSIFSGLVTRTNWIRVSSFHPGAEKKLRTFLTRPSDEVNFSILVHVLKHFMF